MFIASRIIHLQYENIKKIMRLPCHILGSISQFSIEFVSLYSKNK